MENVDSQINYPELEYGLTAQHFGVFVEITSVSMWRLGHETIAQKDKYFFASFLLRCWAGCLPACLLLVLGVVATVGSSLLTAKPNRKSCGFVDFCGLL